MTPNMTDVHSVEEWNNELTTLLIPNDVILSLYILIGIIGNSLVLYVYKIRFTGKIGDRFFVPYLAMTDMFASVVTSAIGLAGNTMQVSFENTYLCKVWWFFCGIATYMSSYTLLIIAVQRYLKVVKPEEKQMNIKMNRLALVSALSFSVLCAAPTLLLYGSVPFPSADGSLVGWRCSKIKDKYKILSIVYGIFVGILFILVIGSLILLYAQIGRTIYIHIRCTKRLLQSEFEKSSSSTKISTEESTSGGNNERNMYTDERNCQNLPIEKTANNCYTRGKDLDNQHQKINKRILHKFTLMFILITVIFLICYIPLVLIMVIEAIIPRFWDDLNNSSRAVVLFFYQMFIINNIANPFVYAFMDTKFQSQLRTLCTFCT